MITNSVSVTPNFDILNKNIQITNSPKIIRVIIETLIKESD